MIRICFVLIFISFQTLYAQVTTYIDEVYYDEDDTYIDEDGIQEVGRTFLLGVDINLMRPRGTFYESNQDNRFGFNFSFLTQPIMDKGLLLGLDVGFNRLDGVSGSFIDVFDGTQRDVDYNTNTNLTMVLVNIRYYFDVYLNKYSPYVEGLIGGKIISTYSSFTDINDEDFAESDWHRFSYSSSFGIGLGTHYTVSESTYLDFRIKYLPGAADQYYRLKDNRDEWDVDIDNYRLDVSKTDVSYMSIGLVFKL